MLDRGDPLTGIRESRAKMHAGRRDIIAKFTNVTRKPGVSLRIHTFRQRGISHEFSRSATEFSGL